MRRRLVAGSALAALVGAGAVIGLAGLGALSAAEALQRARLGLSAAASGGTDLARVTEALAAAERDVAHAEEALSRWPVDVVAAVPLLGRSWRAERAVAATAGHLVSAASAVTGALPGLRAGVGGIDLETLDRLRADLARPAAGAGAALTELRGVPLTLTPAPVRTGVVEAEAGLGPAVDGLQRLHTALGMMSGVLGGDGARSVLVMLQNNAELRGAGGYSSSFATGRLEDGRLQLDALREVESVADLPSRARRVPAPEEFVEDFAAVSGDTTVWRSWNFSPHVPDSALVGARVAGALLPQQPDLVVLLDVPALGAFAALGGGPVVLPDGTAISAEQLTSALLVDAYASAGDDIPAQLARRVALQAAATTAVTRLLTGEVDVVDAARTAARLASQRHLAVWSARPDEQAALVSLGAAGAVEPPAGGDLLHVAVNNIGEDKLDQYVERDLSVDVVLGPGTATVRQRVRFVNGAPDGLVPYVAGFDRPGHLVSLVEFSLPSSAALLSAEVDGRPWVGTHHTGGPRQRLSTRIEIPRGEDAVLEVRYRLPHTGAYALRLVPQPLVDDARLALTVRPAAGSRLGPVDGAARSGGGVEESGPFTAVRDLEVDVLPPRASRWQRLRDGWS